MGRKHTNHTRIRCHSTLWGGKILLTYGFDIYGDFKEPLTERQACNRCITSYHKEFPKREISKILIRLFGSKKQAISEIEEISCCTKGCGNCLNIVHNSSSTRRFDLFWLDNDFSVGSAYHP